MTFCSTPERLIDETEFAKRLACSTRHVRRLEDSDPAFPLVVRLGVRMRRWRERDADEYIRRRAGCEAAAASTS
jgi:predicted DNA-binding transcriptional regulator AlpA